MTTSETKVVLITGGSSGIGEASAKLFSQKGYKVALSGSRAEKVERVAAECGQLSPSGFQPLALVLDFHVPENGAVAVRKTIEHFGRLDVLVNNAGIFVRTLGDDPNTYAAYREVMDVNTDATVCATLAAVQELKRTHGNLVFVSSVASVKPSERGYAYCMSKAAMSSFAKCLAIDLAPEVRVNIVSPGPVDTPIFDRVGLPAGAADAIMGNSTLRKRVGRPEEIAEAVYFLASDAGAGSFMTGTDLMIDGGYIIKPSAFNVSQQLFNASKQLK